MDTQSKSDEIKDSGNMGLFSWKLTNNGTLIISGNNSAY